MPVIIVQPEKLITTTMIIDTTSMELQVPGKKMKKIRAEVRSLKQGRYLAS